MAKQPSEMTAGEINRALDRLDKRYNDALRRLIEAGRGHERFSDTVAKDDPLSREYREISEERSALRREIDFRYGPGAPSRLPSRGFGPIRHR